MDERVVVVVHGVGDPQPGDALTGLVSGYCVVTGASMNGAPVVDWQEDATHKDASSAGVIPLFPVHKLTATSSPSSGEPIATQFHEVYWGDLSRLKGSLLGLVEGTVDLVFGLRHVVFAAQGELAAATRSYLDSRVSATAIGASTTALWLIRGPILALNILGVIASLLYAGLGLFPEKALVHVDISLTAVAAGALLAAVLGSVLFVTATKSKWSTTTAESMSLVGAATLFAASFAPDRYRDYTVFAQDLTACLSVFAGMLAVAILLLLGASLVVAVLFGALSAREASLKRTVHRALITINSCTILSCGLFVFLVMLAWAVIAQQLDTHSTLRGRITDGLHLFGLVWLSFLSIGLVYCGLLLRSWWPRRQPLVKGRRFPRFILHRYVVIVLIASGIVWPGMFLPLAIDLECKHFTEKDNPVCSYLSATPTYQLTVVAVERLNPIGVVLSGALFSLLLAGRAHVGTALDIVLDVISHFKRPERNAFEVMFSRVPQQQTHLRKQPGMRSSMPDAPAEPSEWNAMVGRFREVVEAALRSSTGNELTVIAHSQGTMIALEALGVISILRADAESKTRRVRLNKGAECRIHLVTMGCPLGDLYMHYFPQKYQINERAESLVDSWRNVHRANDFVGTRVVNDRDTTFPINMEVGPRGHVNYWLDREVLEALYPARTGFTAGNR